MILDYNPLTHCYILRVPRGEVPVEQLMLGYGLDLSTDESTGAISVLYTRDPFCAASFLDYATGAARAQLDWIGRAVAASRALGSDRHIDLPPDMELMPFQKADVDYLMNRHHGLDGDEMGLGKTPTAIAVANEMQAKRVLVVCPASVRLQWERQIRKWSTMKDPHIYQITAAKYGSHSVAEWTIVSYDLARKPGVLRGLVRQHFDLLIPDEIHYCKTSAAARTRALFGYHDNRVDDGESETKVSAYLAEVCDKVVGLSGSPLLNRPAEAFVPMQGLNHASCDFATEKEFRERYNPRERNKTKDDKVWTKEETGREPELGNRLRSYIMCRHLEIEVRDQLKYKFPEPIYDLIYLEETAAVKQALELERMLDIDPENLAGADIEILGQVSTVRREMGVAMAPQVGDYVAELIENGSGKLVVFGWHTEVLDILQGALAPYGCVRVDGRDSGASKDAKVQRFISDATVRVILGNTIAMGVGTDGLQLVSSHVLMAEPDWVPGNNEQPVRRLNRIGQLSRVLADFFVAPNSIAEKVLATALRKGAVIDRVLDKRVSHLIEKSLW